MKKTFYLTKEFLISNYIEKKLTAPKISKIIGCTFTTIYLYLKKYNIKCRKRIHYFKFCIDCNKKLDYSATYRNQKRCMKCMGKARLGNNHHGWKGGLPKCIDCGKQLKCYNAKRCLDCVKHYLSKTFRGINHPGWLGGPFNCINCGKKLTQRKGNPSYIHGQGRKNYSIEFRPSLKQKIRKRDNFKCQCCGLLEVKNKRGIKHINLSIHHIDYNKENCKKKNLISVCQVCNSKVNFNRDYWYAYFRYLLDK